MSWLLECYGYECCTWHEHDHAWPPLNHGIHAFFTGLKAHDLTGTDECLHMRKRILVTSYMKQMLLHIIFCIYVWFCKPAAMSSWRAFSKCEVGHLASAYSPTAYVCRRWFPTLAFNSDLNIFGGLAACAETTAIGRTTRYRTRTLHGLENSRGSTSSLLPLTACETNSLHAINQIFKSKVCS